MRPVSFLLILLAIATAPAAHGASRYSNLDDWLAHELLPHVRQTLASHPRFSGESLRFVVLENGQPQPLSNTLAFRIRDRLRETAADVPGIRIAWQPDDPHQLQTAGSLDCTRGEADYLVGVEVRLASGGRVAVSIRALDLEDRTTVNDFSRDWQGPMNSGQYRDFRHIQTDPAFRGERDVPYDESQVDLLAAHLAHDLGCTLLRQTEAEYVITESAQSLSATLFADLVELVSNNLAQYSTLQFTSTDSGANAVINGKAHRIDEDLYQYWVTVQGKEAGSELTALSASAYVRLPQRFVEASLYEPPPAPEMQTAASILASFRVVELANAASCRTARGSGSVRAYGEARPDCYALQVDARDDAIIFFLNHQLNNGLVRLADGSCSERAAARIARSDRTLEFPLPEETLDSATWTTGAGWQTEPDHDTFYAIAASDSKAARALSRHIEELPKRCTGSVRPGLEGFELRRWMEELAAIVNYWEPAIDWQTIRVKNVY